MRAVVVALVVAASLVACEAASPDPGLGALLQVENAQFRPGRFPVAEGGPAALALASKHSEIVIGEVDETIRAVLESHARGAVIGLEGEDGTWLVAAGSPELDTPDYPSARVTFGLAESFPAGPFTLLVAASDKDGRFGEPASTMIIANDAPVPDGELVIGLYWDGRADLDIHVVDALGGEAWSEDPNTWVRPPPGSPVDPTAHLAGGMLDHDGNKDCVREGSPNEHVIWQLPPPDGAYAVRVDARSLCGDASAAWYVAAYRSGELVGAARGIATPDLVRLPHGAGAGITALQFACGAEGCARR